MRGKRTYLRVPTNHVKEKALKKNCCTTCCCLTATAVAILITGTALLIVYVFLPWVFVTCSFKLATVNTYTYNYYPKIVTFSSCMGNWLEHDIMNEIKSDMHIFLGDSIYTDDYAYELPAITRFLNLPRHILPYYEMMYRKLSCRSTFRGLLDRTKYVLATWDDHDYGADDELNSNPVKHQSKEMFTDFWKLNMDRRKVHGLYGSYKFQDLNNSMLFIIPDLKFSSSKIKLFAEDQWQWLKKILDTSITDNTVILCMSTPITELIKTYHEEVDFLLTKLNASHTVILAGDPHWPSIQTLPYGHIEIISSPLSMVGKSIHEHTMCNKTCSIQNNQDNYGMIDFTTNTAKIIGRAGVLLEIKLFNAK